ncbi:hypothetical protein AGMMS50262_23780 [Bacteroidia bacterium]|nr:hypothetical protein AGMMS50262_23780 [Bacteroidia bacterium]
MRATTKIGDVFSVKIDENNKKYFQLIAFDLTQLNSDVIRAFEKKYGMNENPTLAEIIQDDVEFYAHCVTDLGKKLKLWDKVGNIADTGSLNHILFRDTSDYGVWISDEPIKISQNWYVWRIGGNFIDVGKLKGENRKAEIGVIVNPFDIVNRIKTGKYNFFYPDFE